LLDATASHEVIVPLEDMTRAVPAIWFPGPLFDVARRLSMRSSGRALPRRSIDRRSAFFSFDPLQRPTHDAAGSSRPLGRRHQAPPMRFRALPRHQRFRFARHGECQPAAAFRPQVFTTSRRFAPRDALRACFIPLARPGFALQGFSLARSRFGFSPRLCPLVVTPNAPPLSRRKRSEPRFRALLPWRVRCVRTTVKRVERPIPSWAFPSPRHASLRPQAVLPQPSPHGLAETHVRDVVATPLRVLPDRRMGASLARRPAFVRFAAFSITLPFGFDSDRAYRFASGGMLRHRCTAPAL